MTSRSKKLLLLAIGLVAGLVLAEISLRLYSLVVPRRSDILSRAWTPITIDDPRLGIRPNPAYPEHDANGFRNRSVPKEAFVVALGDSHTYGTGVRMEQTWPKQLEAGTGRTVYSIASGGWGPTQCLILFDQALTLRPKLIVFALYDGNDFYDSFANVYNDGQLPELRTADPALSAAIREAEAKEKLSDRFSKVYRQQQGLGEDTETTESPSLGARIVEFFHDHSRFYRLASAMGRAATRKLRAAAWQRAEIRDDSDGPKYEQAFESGGARTIFTPAYRLFAMDLSDPRLAEGFRISLDAIREMNARAGKAGVPFLVLLLPTKEIVFREKAAGTPADAGDYRKTVETEAGDRQKAADFLRQEGIPFLDPLPALQQSLAKGEPPYPASSDGHPNPAGYRIIAGMVAGEMKSRGLAGP